MTLEDQIACVKREIAMRESVYPKWVAAKKMSQAKADHELAAMKAVLETLENVDHVAQMTVEITLEKVGDLLKEMAKKGPA